MQQTLWQQGWNGSNRSLNIPNIPPQGHFVQDASNWNNVQGWPPQMYPGMQHAQG